LSLQSPQLPSYALLKQQVKSNTASTLQSLWQSRAPQTYQDLGISTSPKYPGKLQHSCLSLGRILAARTGHGDFADYHEWFKHEDANLLCQCGARKAPLHFFFCRIAKRRAPRPLGPPLEVIPFLLGSVKGAQKLAMWLTETRFYEDICHCYTLLSS
jgi:hypothetical protein